MKNLAGLFYAFVGIYLFSHAIVAAGESKLVPNAHFVPGLGTTTDYYFTSGLSQEELRVVLGLEPIISVPGKSQSDSNGRELSRVEMLKNIVKKWL